MEFKEPSATVCCTSAVLQCGFPDKFSGDACGCAWGSNRCRMCIHWSDFTAHRRVKHQTWKPRKAENTKMDLSKCNLVIWFWRKFSRQKTKMLHNPIYKRAHKPRRNKSPFISLVKKTTTLAQPTVNLFFCFHCRLAGMTTPTVLLTSRYSVTRSQFLLLKLDNASRNGAQKIAKW